MQRLDTPTAALLRRELLRWYDTARRELPWRARPDQMADPYAVLVSEVMLQQTTVASVVPRFRSFMARFPTLTSLAAAPPEAVVHEWQGLGYYRRARALHACAQLVVAEHGGCLPADLAALRRLPGLGPYTAAAVAAIAFGQSVVPVDGNVERVLGRLLALNAAPAETRQAIREAAAGLASPERPGDLAQAVMELGALVCRPRVPACLLCPWHGMCGAAASGTPEAFPRATVRPERPVPVAWHVQCRRARHARGISTSNGSTGAARAVRHGVPAAAGRWQHPVSAAAGIRAAGGHDRAAGHALAEPAPHDGGGGAGSTPVATLARTSGHRHARLHASRAALHALGRTGRRRAAGHLAAASGAGRSCPADNDPATAPAWWCAGTSLTVATRPGGGGASARERWR